MALSGIYMKNSGIVSVLICLFSAAALISGCAKHQPPPKAPTGYPKPYKIGKEWYQPIPHARDFSQKGIASWYGKKFHGRTTSNGEKYNMYAMTAAHKTLPMGTYVRVKNLKNNKEIVVRINDRGPFVRSRIIDLSYTGAKKLDIVGPGTAPVEIVALGARKSSSAGFGGTYTPVDYYSGNFTFQVGAFTNRANAERLVAALNKEYKNAHISSFTINGEMFFRVRVGKYTTLQDIIKDEELLIQKGYADAFIVAE